MDVFIPASKGIPLEAVLSPDRVQGRADFLPELVSCFLWPFPPWQMSSAGQGGGPGGMHFTVLSQQLSSFLGSLDLSFGVLHLRVSHKQ